MLTINLWLGTAQAILLPLSVSSFTLGHSRYEIDRHWAYTIGLSAVLLAGSFLSFLKLIIPSSAELSPIDPDPSTGHVQLILSYVELAFVFAAFVTAGTTPRCAPLGKHATGLAAAKVIGPGPGAATDALANEHGPTGLVAATGFLSCSPISFILFGWISPVLQIGQTVETLRQEDLPVLGARDRAPNLWSQIQSSAQVGRGPGFVNPLLWRVIRTNQGLFMGQVILAFVTSFLYYLPALFLQRLVAFLEARPRYDDGSFDNTWGYIYCLGLLVAGLSDAACQGQLWFLSVTMLATRIKVQLNCLVFDKTLKRKDVAGTAQTKKKDSPTASEAAAGAMGASPDAKAAEPVVATEADADADEEEEEEGKETFSTKSAVLNLFTIDVDRIAQFAEWAFSIVDAPMEIIIGTVFLYRLLGWAAFAGISVAVLFLPVNHYTSNSFASVQDKLMTTRDKRVSLMNEVLQSIRMIKYMAFEKPFEKRIEQARAEELKQLRRNFYLEVIFQAIWGVSPILCVLVSFGTYTIVMKQDLTPSTAFAALAVWNELRFALNIIPEILVQALQTLVSLRRLEKYLATPEVDDVVPQGALTPAPATNPAFVNATVTWPQKVVDPNAVAEDEEVEKPFELQGLDVSFPAAQFSLVCGNLGAGKTLLLLALLGEADVLSGEVLCPRSPPDAISLPSIEWDKLITDDNWVLPNCAAFVPQNAWLQNATLQDNVTFGLPFRQARYDAVLAACSLVSDIAILEDGDQTEIGEKGINLSGGQKARVSLARAVYSRASLLLLDDVLSAVDNHTAQHIFQSLTGPLMQGRTIILVSHSVALVAPGADYVVHLDNGRVKFAGQGSAFLESPLFKKEKEEEEPVESLVPAEQPKLKNKQLGSVIQADTTASTPTSSTDVSDASDDEDTESDGTKKDGAGKEKKPRKLIEDENRAVGRVSREVWSSYLTKMGGLFFWAAFVFSFVGFRLSDVGQTWWLGKWAGSYNNPTETTRSVEWYLGLYALLAFFAVIVEVMQWFVLYWGTLKASERLYAEATHSILRAPLRFFDTQALGRLLNRFGKDTEQIDANLPDHLGRALMYFLGCVTTLIAVGSSAPIFAAGFLFVMAPLYLHHARLFSFTARELRRLDSISKSPLYSIYGESIAGVAVIRAFGSSQRFMALMLERCSTNVTFYWYTWAVNRWLSMRFAVLSSVTVALAGFSLIRAGDKVDAALAGFALTFALNLSSDILFLVRRWTNLEMALVAVERLKELADCTPEAPLVMEPRPPASWPHAGAIDVQDLTIRYAPELPDVLHSVSFSVAGGEKVGICGATGCGKSTLAQACFRFVEPWGGRIVVDGIDTTQVGLYDLRSRLTIIPQDPVLLSGTLRSTLDMLGEYDDRDIFDALRRVHLIKSDEANAAVAASRAESNSNQNQFGNLEVEVTEGGANFSNGQRQLLAMARALLRRNKILLLDEATASVDADTDELISQTIREEFADSTLLVIAHRLR